MLKSMLFGSETAEKTMLYLANNKQAYASEIANAYQVSVSQVQRQLEKLELNGVIVSRMFGKTRMYEWNPRYLFQTELQALLKSILKAQNKETTKAYFRTRTRPRRAGKPL